MFDNGETKRRLNEAEDDIVQLKRKMSALELDWQDMHGRMKTLLMRLNKRVEREEKGPDGSRTNEPRDPAQPTLTRDTSPHGPRRGRVGRARHRHPLPEPARGPRGGRRRPLAIRPRAVLTRQSAHPALAGWDSRRPAGVFATGSAVEIKRFVVSPVP